MAWLLGAALYLPEQWLTSEARQAAQIPRAIRFQEKWRLALALLRRVRASGMQVTAVLGDAEFGDNGTLRQYLRRVGLPYALGISSHLTVFPNGKPSAVAVRAIAERLPRRAWRVVTWRNGANRAWKAQFAALRVTPAQRWPHRRRAPEVWLLCERDFGATPRTSNTLSRCPCRHRAPPSCTWRTSGGPSNSSTKSSKTNRGSIISRGDRLSGGIAMSP